MARRSDPFRQKGVVMHQIYNNGSFIFRNVMEEFVEEKLDKLMCLEAICCCSECCTLVKKEALKELPPLHATCISEDIHAHFMGMSTQTQADIITAILHSVETLRKYPQHCTAQK